MEMEPFENPWIKKIRLLTHLLLASIALNIGLGTSFVLRKTQQNRKGVKGEVVSKTLKLQPSNADVLKTYFETSFGELAYELEKKELLQDGYTKRDLALACLVSFHHFDIARAVARKQLHARTLSFVHAECGEHFDLEVYPGLDETDFQLISNFIKREKWPLTT